MGRKNFYEILNDLTINVRDEYAKLLFLFDEEPIAIYHGCPVTLKDYLNDEFFRDYDFRNSCIDMDSLINKVGIPIIPSDQLDDLLLFSEFLLALVFFPYGKRISDFAVKQFNYIVSNIKYICEKTNHVTKEIDGKLIILEQSKATSLAVELVSDKAIILDLLEYNHYAIKGHLSEKKKILFEIGQYVEAILKTGKLKKNSFNRLESDAGFFLNHFHIRHNNKEGAYAQEYIISISDEELEDWYDKIYNTLLSVIIINEQIDINSELNDLKRNYKWKS